MLHKMTIMIDAVQTGIRNRDVWWMKQGFFSVLGSYLAKLVCKHVLSDAEWCNSKMIIDIPIEGGTWEHCWHQCYILLLLVHFTAIRKSPYTCNTLSELEIILANINGSFITWVYRNMLYSHTLCIKWKHYAKFEKCEWWKKVKLYEADMWKQMHKVAFYCINLYSTPQTAAVLFLFSVCVFTIWRIPSL